MVLTYLEENVSGEERLSILLLHPGFFRLLYFCVNFISLEFERLIF